jgi:hypothetical protein
MYRGFLGRLCPPRIDDDEVRAIIALQTVKNAGPEHCLGKGRIMADMKNGIRQIKVFICSRITIAAKRFHEGHCSRRRAESRVAVHMGRLDAGVANQR